jgi:hypothetical protein
MELRNAEPAASLTAPAGFSAAAPASVRSGLFGSRNQGIAFVAPGGARNSGLNGVDPDLHRVQGVITLAPTVVDTGTSSRVTITASGFFDLAEVTESQISFRPGQGVSNIQIAGATAQRLVVTFDISEDAALGTRTLLIKNNAGATVVALDIAFNLGSHICRPACELPQRCSGNVCVGCRPPCQDPLVCRGNFCVRPTPPQCTPPCRPPFFCNDFGQCERAK